MITVLKKPCILYVSANFKQNPLVGFKTPYTYYLRSGILCVTP